MDADLVDRVPGRGSAERRGARRGLGEGRGRDSQPGSREGVRRETEEICTGRPRAGAGAAEDAEERGGALSPE